MSSPKGFRARLYAQATTPITLCIFFNRRYEDVRPQGIASCLDSSDVRESILWAREHEVPVAIRLGGHNYAGYSTTDGLLVDLDQMRSVDVNDDTGVAKVQVGARNTDVYAELQPHEAAISAGRCPTVAIGGLVLGGGIGFSSRKLGLTCDSLVETEIVTADGQILTCNEKENEDLFWACRGGSGGNFGVNISYTFQTTPVENVSIYDLQWDPEEGEMVLPALQEVALQASDNFSYRMGGRRSGQDGGGFAMFALGGAISGIPKEKTAYVHRDSQFLLAIDSSWSSSDSDSTEQANIDWVEGFADGMRAYTTEYAYQNFIDCSQTDSAHAYYGDNLDRLVRIKRDRDPDDFFQFAQSVPQHRSLDIAS
jgi:hypothetical protein